MKKVLMSLGAVFSLVLVSTVGFHAYATRGFTSSDEKNVFNYRGHPNGATASLVNLPNGERVLATQAHVVEAFKSGVALSWGKFYGWNWKEWSAKDGAFEVAFIPNILWEDEDLDVAFVAVPDGLLQACGCSGLDVRPYHEGPAMMIGYPETGRRTYPLVGYYWKVIGALSGTVEQRKSEGRTWISNGEYIADIDGLPGDSGSTILDADGYVIGMLHLLKGWYGDGYKYKVPSINLLPIELVLKKFEEAKKNFRH